MPSSPSRVPSCGGSECSASLLPRLPRRATVLWPRLHGFVQGPHSLTIISGTWAAWTSSFLLAHVSPFCVGGVVLHQHSHGGYSTLAGRHVVGLLTPPGWTMLGSESPGNPRSPSCTLFESLPAIDTLPGQATSVARASQENPRSAYHSLVDDQAGSTEGSDRTSKHFMPIDPLGDRATKLSCCQALVFVWPSMLGVMN